MLVPKRLFVLLLACLAAFCFMNLTCGPPAPANAAVPFVQQVGENYCAAACVLSWRLHDGYASVTQDSILTSMGGTPSTGVDETSIPGGVDLWTGTHDATLEFGPGGSYSDDQGLFFSRMISSVSVGVPVIALMNSGLHAVVVDGGEWHVDSTTGFNVWDTVEYMDPAVGARGAFPGTFSSSMGFDYTPLTQIISSGAAASGSSNYDLYGDTTVARGIDRGGLCGDCRVY